MAKESASAVAERGSLSARIEIGKNGLALLRDLVLFILVVLLLAFPDKLNDILTRAGFDEGSIVGFKWKAKLLDSDLALKEARQIINDLSQRLDTTSKALAEAQAKSGDSASKAALDDIVAENTRVNAASAKVESAIGRTVEASASFVQDAQAQIASGQWGVVYSGDSSLEGAKYEVGDMARKYGLPNATVFRRQGSYRSVALAEERAVAEDILSKARKRRGDAYIVRMSTWCPNFQTKDGYRDCT